MIEIHLRNGTRYTTGAVPSGTCPCDCHKKESA